MTTSFAGSCLLVLMTAFPARQALAQAGFERGGFTPRPPQILGIVYGESDSCDIGRVASIVRVDTDCEALGNGGARSWSIKIGNACRDINDTTVTKACRAIKYAGAPNIVYGETDNCDETKIMLLVGERTECGLVRNIGARAWSVRLNGQCRNISDTTVGQACLGVQSEMTPGRN